MLKPGTLKGHPAGYLTLAIIYCFVFLYFAAAAGGVWSIDHLREGIKALRPRRQ